MGLNGSVPTKSRKPSASIYDAWGETLLPFLIPAMVLSVWPVVMIFRARNRSPVRLLGIAVLISLADGLLGSCTFPLQHQYAFSLTTNSALFYVGTITYWLGGLFVGPVMEMLGFRCSCMALAMAGIVGAWGSGQSIVCFALVGRAASAVATSGLAAWVEYALYHEGAVQRGHVAASALEGNDKAASLRGNREAISNSGILTLFHQIRPAMSWLSMLASQYAMVATPTVSWAPCWVAIACYVSILFAVWSFVDLPRTSTAALSLSAKSPSVGIAPLLDNSAATGSHARNVNMRDTSVHSFRAEGKLSAAATAAQQPLCGVSMNCFQGDRVAADFCRRWSLRRFMCHLIHTYATSLRTLFCPRYLARHVVVVVFGAAFFAASLLWVPTLELYDDSIPFGFVFQLFMLAMFLGSTFTLPVWAVGGAEAALVVLLNLSERTLFTSRDYAIPVTILLSGIVLHLTHGALVTMGSLWRAEYPVASVTLTFLFVLKACTGILGWVLLHILDGRYMEDAFVFEARWMRGLMWVAAVALAQYIVGRMASSCEYKSSCGANVSAVGLVAAQEGNMGNLEDHSITPV